MHRGWGSPLSVAESAEERKEPFRKQELSFMGAGNGYYYDLTEIVEKTAPKLYKAVDPWWEIGTLHGKIYGVPMLKDLGAGNKNHSGNSSLPVF